MKKIKKKGFTIVELVIVILVIGILSAILIPTFSDLIEKAKYTTDTEVCTNMRTSLVIDFGMESPANIVEVKNSLKKEYSKHFVPETSGLHYYWCELDNYIYLIDDSKNNFIVKFPTIGTTVTKDNSYRLDKEYYTITTNINGISLDKSVIEQGTENVEVKLIATGVAMPEKVKIGETEYNVTNDKITIETVTSNIIISKFVPPLNYLTFTANENNSSVTPKFVSGTYQYSTLENGSTTWSDWSDGAICGTTVINLEKIGDKVRLKGKNCITGYDEINDVPINFSMTGKIIASGEVTSLTNEADGDVVLSDSCYSYMFYGCTSLATAPELPATTLAEGCYYNMFGNCTTLITAPELPATTLNDGCYCCMFIGCTALVNAPSLPVTALTAGCYAGMFADCTALTTAPALPATTLNDCCYDSMFFGCTALVNAPSLPATTLDTECYKAMFKGCTALETAPSLPATTLVKACYIYMFKDCTALTTAPVISATTLGSECCCNMFEGCTALEIAPALPAETLAEGCYWSMFLNCTNLVNVTEIKGTSVNFENCCKSMFEGCSSLKIATTSQNKGGGKIFECTSTADNCVTDMFKGCTAGLFNGTPEVENTYYWYTTLSYTIKTTLSNVTADSKNVSTIDENNSVTLKFTANNNYAITSDMSISVSGVSDYDWSVDEGTGTLELTNPICNVEIEISGLRIFSITVNASGVNKESSQTTIIEEIENVTIGFNLQNGYVLADNPINVKNANYTSTSPNDNGFFEVDLDNATDNVTITITTRQYFSISFNNTNVSLSGTTPTRIFEDENLELTFTANDGYYLPSEVTTSNSTHTWNDTTGKLVISNSTGDVTVQIVAILKVAPTVTTPPTEKTDLNVNNSAQKLIDDSNISYNGGTIQYALGTDDTTAPTSGYSETIPTGETAGKYYVWYKVVGDNSHTDTTPSCITVIITNYLTFTALENNSGVAPKYLSGTLMWSKSTDNGATWTQWYSAGAGDYEGFIPLNEGDKIRLKGDNCKTYSYGNYGSSISFKMEGRISASGDVTSITNGIGGDAELTDHCYCRMFEGCTALETAPALPSTTLANYCYNGMFASCTSLKVAPAFTAEIVSEASCKCMFSGCSKLEEIPIVLTQTFKNKTSNSTQCYYSMFDNCSNLKIGESDNGTIPEGATVIFTFDGSENTYDVKNMFSSTSNTINNPTPKKDTYFTYYWYTGK